MHHGYICLDLSLGLALANLGPLGQGLHQYLRSPVLLLVYQLPDVKIHCRSVAVSSQLLSQGHTRVTAILCAGQQGAVEVQLAIECLLSWHRRFQFQQIFLAMRARGTLPEAYRRAWLQPCTHFKLLPLPGVCVVLSYPLPFFL